MYPHRPLVPGRIPELLENLKSEFETLAHDVNMYKMQRDDYERKLQAQLTELNNIQQTLYDLERNHAKIKQQYEEELMRMRRQHENGGLLPSQGRDGQGSSATVPSLPDKGLPSLTGPLSYGGTVPFASMPSVPVGPPGGGSGPNVGDKRPFPGPPNQNPAKRPRLDEGSGGFSLSPLTAAALEEEKKGDRKDSGLEGGLPPARGPRGGLLPGRDVEGDGPEGELGRRGGGGEKRLHSSAVTKDLLEASSALEREGALPSMKKDPTGTASAPSSSSGGKEPLSSQPGAAAPGGAGSPVGGGGGGPQDWIVGYNPSVSTNLHLELRSTLEHESVVCCVKFSHDGRYLATGCNRSAQLFDVETGERVHSFSEDSKREGDLYIRSVCFSPDTRLLATGDEDRKVQLWGVESRKVTATFTGHESDIYSLDFSADGNTIVSGSGDKKVRVWDIESGKCLHTLGNDEVGPKDGVTSVAFSPDGRYVAAGSLDRIVRLWDAHNGYFLERYEGHLDSVYSVAFAPDGKSLASGSLDKTLKLWDLSGSRSRTRCRASFSGHKDFVLSVAFSPDGNWLISGSKDRSVQFWDPKLAVTHMMLQGHKNSVISVAVCPKNNIFATGSGDFRARVWKYAK